MRRDRYEFAAIPIIVVLLGTIFALFGASRLGWWAWIVVGVVIFAGTALFFWWLAGSRQVEVGGEPPPARAPTDDAVHRVLVVTEAGRPAAGYEALVAAHAEGRPTEAYVIVPTMASRLDRVTGDEHAYESASRQLEETLAALTRTGVAAQGRIGAHDTLQAIDDALREFAAEEIVAAIEAGELDRARQRYELPVTAVGTA